MKPSAKSVGAWGGLVALSGWLSVAACGSNDGARGAPGTSAIITSTTQPPDDNCPAGGFVIVSGIDVNNNGKLDKGEATTQYACNGIAGDAGTPGQTGQDGLDGRRGDPGDPGPKGDRGDAGPQGAQGDAGPQGAQGDAGPRGAQGDAGPQGAQGDAGPQGAQGDAGANGLNALVSVDQEPGGANCPFGGLRVRSGLDVDADGQLSDAEAGPAHYVCNGAPGAGSGDASAGGTGSAGTAAVASAGAA